MKNLNYIFTIGILLCLFLDWKLTVSLLFGWLTTVLLFQENIKGNQGLINDDEGYLNKIIPLYMLSLFLSTIILYNTINKL